MNSSQAKLFLVHINELQATSIMISINEVLKNSVWNHSMKKNYCFEVILTCLIRFFYLTLKCFIGSDRVGRTKSRFSTSE